MVAVIITSTIMLVVTQLLTRADEVVELSRERLGAASLAREGLELTRSIRDTNWFQSGTKTQWLIGICQTGNTKIYAPVQFTVTPKQVRDSNTIGGVADSRIELTNSDIVYDRMITVECGTQDDEPAYVVVTSDVKWTHKGQERHVIIKEKLFNWFPS